MDELKDVCNDICKDLYNFDNILKVRSLEYTNNLKNKFFGKRGYKKVIGRIQNICVYPRVDPFYNGFTLELEIIYERPAISSYRNMFSNNFDGDFNLSRLLIALDDLKYYIISDNLDELQLLLEVAD